MHQACWTWRKKEKQLPMVQLEFMAVKKKVDGGGWAEVVVEVVVGVGGLRFSGSKASRRI